MTLSYRAQTKLLIALNAIVALALGGWFAISAQTDQQPAPYATDDGASGHSPIARQPLRTDEIEAHPLFSPSRLPVIVETPASPPVVEAARVPPLLVGILLHGDGKLGGLLEDPPSGAKKFVRQGEVFMGWTLTSLGARTVVLRFGAQEVELQLSFNSKDPPRPGTFNPVAPAPRTP